MGDEKVTESIYQIDAEVFKIPNFTSAYLIVGEKLALVESGPANSAPRILEGIRGFGFDPADISYIIITHIHLDHGGGAGTLLKDMPKAKIVVHEKGAKHMIDPSKLVNSSKMVFGDLIDEWYGEVLPVDKEKVMPVKDNDIIDLGKGQKLRMIDSPGHAVHHICIYSEKDKGLFTGDAAGVYIPQIDAVVPTTPPPEFDPDINMRTMKDFLKLDLKRLLFSHFGSVEEVEKTLNISIDLLSKWKGIVEGMKSEDITIEKISEKFVADTKKIIGNGVGAETLTKWVLDHHIPMCAAGYYRYFNKK
ncbi:MAG: MBL fold metallo-hydrolase [Spirochaetota bacterium]|nr:MBL fold metallo-hydrolase [Spirochaetota bacterium]